ncbi:unnamed protein product [Auanema sp. JU1783]|nr:unnamed protein product [Auanema sp. JU1783]
MQTVKLNKKAMVVLGGCVIFFIIALSYLPSSEPSPIPRVPVRAIRHQINEQHPVKHSLPLDNRIEDFDVERADEKLRKEVVKPDFSDEVDQNDNAYRQKFVKDMMLHAWNGYKNYSWGANEVRPIAKSANSQAIFGGKDMPATIVDAADTLWIMGLKKEYQDARDYIKEHMDMAKATGTLSVFETTIRFLGGLLSLYALTKEEFYIDKARGVGEALLPAFNTPTGIPKSNIDMSTKYASNYAWANGGSSILAEYGSLHLEFVYLSKITKQPIFEKKVKKIRNYLDKLDKVNGLYPNYINPETGKWSLPYHISLGALGDSYYEYLIKSWIQSGKKDNQAKKMYWDTSDAVQKHMVFRSAKSNLTYVAELRSGQPDHKMGHLACFCVGMFALQAVNEPTQQLKEKTMSLAEELGKTCHESYIRSQTGIGPEMFYFSPMDEATSLRNENGYILRPEVLEGFFYLWRLTGKEKYRDWVWTAIQAMEKYCKKEGGYAGLRNVYNPSQGSDDVQQSFFLAETLKYAYLTFTDTSVMDLNKWVFNTEAHAFPIDDSASE